MLKMDFDTDVKCFDFAYRLMMEKDNFRPTHFSVNIQPKKTMWWYSIKFYDKIPEKFGNYCETYSEKIHFHHRSFAELLTDVGKISNLFELRGLKPLKHRAGRAESDTISGLIDNQGVCDECHMSYKKTLNYDGNWCERCAIEKKLTTCALCGKTVNDGVSWSSWTCPVPSNIDRFCDNHRVQIVKHLFKICKYTPSPEDHYRAWDGWNYYLKGNWQVIPTNDDVLKFVENKLKLFAKRLLKGEVAGYCTDGECIRYGKVLVNGNAYCNGHAQRG